MQVDLLSPLRVRVSFPPIIRRQAVFMDANPTDLIDYRDIPILFVEGNDTVSVSRKHFDIYACDL